MEQFLDRLVFKTNLPIIPKKTDRESENKIPIIVNQKHQTFNIPVSF